MAYTRKLQKIGESLFVSLPKTWTERMQLNKGDSIVLIEQPDSVVIHPRVGLKSDKIKQIILDVDIEESIRSLKRRITGAYVDGFDVIKLRAVDKFTVEQRDIIRERTKSLFGLEIIEIKSDLIGIQCLMTKMLPIESTIQKVHGIIKPMFSEVISALRDRNPKAVKSVIERTQDVHRLSLVLHRLLRSVILFPTERTLELKPIDSVDFLRVVNKITEVSTSMKKIVESVAMWDPLSPDSILESLLVIFDEILESYEWSMQALMSKNVPLANRTLDKKLDLKFDALWESLINAEENVEISAPTFSHIHRIIDNLKQIHTYTLETAEIAIDRAEEP